MTHKSHYNQLIAAIDQARKPTPLGPPTPRNMPRSLIAPVYNANWTRAFEENITDIHPGTRKGQWKGTVTNSLGRNGRTLKVWFNQTRRCWQYV
jgi:hypothetical protein